MNRLQLTTSQRLPALLMAVVALWALIFAIASLAGLGGRYRVHPDDPSRVPPLPALDLSQAHSLLQAADAYADIGERPLFNPDRRPLPPDERPAGDGATDEPAPPSSPLDIVVTSIIMTSQLKLAIVTDNRNGKSQSIKLGDALEGEQSGWRLTELEPRKAVFAGPDGNSAVDLRVFDGAGGQAPTPAAVMQAQGSEASQEEGMTAQVAQLPQPEAGKTEAMTPEARAEMIRRRIEERRRQMREEAERANNR